MQHTCYHVISDQNNQFFNALEDVKTTIGEWRALGESHIKVFKIITEELGSDAINLEEEQIGLEEIVNN